MDSGAFTTIEKYGGYPEPVEVYAEAIMRFHHVGKLIAAVAQDYMCEPFMLARTGMTVADHQRLTIERYDQPVECNTGVYILPVLQGYHPLDYVDHVWQYGDRLKPGMWVGVGSVCKRNARAEVIEEVLGAIRYARPDLKLHGFGLKITALGSKIVRQSLVTSDSIAWSAAARREGRDANDWREAARYVSRVEDILNA